MLNAANSILSGLLVARCMALAQAMAAAKQETIRANIKVVARRMDLYIFNFQYSLGLAGGIPSLGAYDDILTAADFLAIS